MDTRLDLVLTALNTLEAAMDALNSDEELTPEQRLSLGVMLNQVRPCVASWRNEIRKAQSLVAQDEPNVLDLLAAEPETPE